MMNTTKMKGRLLLFDKPTSNKTLFPKNCEITYAEKVPVIWEFRFNDPGSVMGFGHVTRDENGLICKAEITPSDAIVDILREFDGELPIGGYYSGVKSHQGNHLRIFDSGRLTCIGVTLSPVDEEYRMRVVEKGEENEWFKRNRTKDK